MRQLNPQQHAAVHYLDSPLLVLAGAGSGKTLAITHKIAYLIQQAGYQAKHIAAVTFTNKAAREMQARVSKLLPNNSGKGLRVSTFHTLGLDIVRQDATNLGLKRNLSIFDSQDSHALLRELANKGNTALEKDAVDAAQTQISLWKNRLITPAQALSHAEDDLIATAARLYQQYQDQLHAYNAVDFDDLILLPVQLFQTNPAVLEKWQGRIRYLLVDEYQDTNTSQYELVKLLVGLRGQLTVVGDDDQSIYAWRGAQPENLALLKRDFPRLQVIKLEQNYRSSNHILRAANHLIAHNPHVFDKALWSDKGEGEPLRVVEIPDGDKEAEKVISNLLNHKLRHGRTFEDYAILYRSNHQARPFEQALRDQQIPYYLSGGTSFFARAEVKDLMAYLRLLVNPHDDAAFIRIANIPRREIGPTTLQKLGTYAKQRHLSLFNASFELGLAQQLTERAYTAVQRFSDFISRYADRAQRDNPQALLIELVDAIRYEAWLKDSCNDLRTAERRMANVQELLNWLGRLAEQEDKNLAELVAHLTLLDVLERQNEDEGQKGVALMTLHAAKGLEFPHVFLVGVEEDILPHHNNQDSDAGLQEERRLLYVGITRAQHSLTLTYAKKRQRYGETQQVDASRFLQELPQDGVEWLTGVKAKPQQTQEVGRAHLAHMRALLQK